jgi:hypothetical protein
MPDDAEANLLPQPHTPLRFHPAPSAGEGSDVAGAQRVMIAGSSFACQHQTSTIEEEHTMHQFIHQFKQQFMPRRHTRFSHEAPTRQIIRSRFALWSLKPSLAAIAALLMLILAAATVSAASYTPKAQTAQAAQAAQVLAVTTGPCASAKCRFQLEVNPALLSGGRFACPAIQDATATITITNRFATNAQNDVMTLKAEGLPKNTGFDLFLVQHSPLEAGFGGFGFGWYQSDLQSNEQGEASVRVQGIFDKETFIENPADPFTPIHTYNVGFWFNSPTDQAAVCGGATPPKGPFNGEQNAGLLAMITSGGPLQLVQ